MKNKILFCTMILSCMFSMFVNAQLKVANNGNIGIQLSATDNPLSCLSISGVGLTNTSLYITRTANPNNNGYGIYSTITGGMTGAWKCSIAGYSKANAGLVFGIRGDAGSITTTSLQIARMYGVYGIAGGASNGKNYGVYGILQAGNSKGTGVYGSNNDTVQVLSERYAGYFRGKTYINGDLGCVNFLGSSDARLKTNILDIKSDALQKVNNLHPVQFQWRQFEDVVAEDTTTIKVPHFSEDMDFEQKHYGFLAQEVQKLLPELVKENGDGYLSISYIELIPLLVQAVQELSAEVEELRRSNVARTSQKKDITQAILYQNSPNPLSADTKIEYQLPQSTQNAVLYIYNMNGLQVAEYPIDSYGVGNIIVEAGQLDAGMYLYSLIADGKIIDTKRMILTK